MAEPERGRVPLATEGLMLTLVALLLVQLRVALCPAFMVVAEDCRETEGCDPELEEPEPPPHAASAMISEKQKLQRTKRSQERFRPKTATLGQSSFLTPDLEAGGWA